jgi:hypothetical protein
MWTRFVVGLVAVVSVGCSAAGAETVDGVAVDGADVTLSPEPALLAAAESAAARWPAATGLRIVVASGGVPLTVVVDAVDPSGYRVCAFTSASPVSGPVGVAVDIDPPAGVCNSVDQVVAHEIGHVIARTFDPMHGDSHAAAGLMKPRNGTAAIDSESLAAVCEYAPCTVFQPES